ncbi:MAG: NADH-quinone oxidoreductase subunit NuoF [Pseudomonadota bacterium]
MTKIITQNFGNPTAREVFTYERLGGYANLRKAVHMPPEKIIEEVKTANLRGRGGAGFPAGVKWGFVPKDAKTVYLVINADEGEPGTFKDRWLMHWDPHRLIEGACIAAYAIRAHKAYIYIRGELFEEAAILEKAIEQAYSRGYLGQSMAGSGWAMDMVVHRGAGAYVCGEETALLDSIEGRRGHPRLKPPFPAIKGLFGEPTIVNNVETLMNVPTIIEKGGQWFAGLGVEKDGGTRAAAVSGHVKLPGVYEIPVGTSLKSIIYDHAGGMRGSAPLKAVIPGGTSMPVLTANEVDVPYANDAMAQSEKIREVEIRPGELFRFGGGRTLRSMPGSGAIVVMEKGTDMVAVAARIMRFYAHESCGQCTPCREGTGWMSAVCSRLAKGEGNPGDVDLLASIASGISGYTICALGDAAAWPMLAFITKFRKEFEERIRR